MDSMVVNVQDLEKSVGVEALNKLFVEYLTLTHSMKTDQYGNNTDFPSSVISDITTKGLLGKWTGMIASRIGHVLHKYHMKTQNIDAGDKPFVISLFQELKQDIRCLTPVLEDSVNEKLYGIEDIFIAVYGITSDEVYMLKDFLKLFERIPEWDEDYMWDDCATDNRMRQILM